MAQILQPCCDSVYFCFHKGTVVANDGSFSDIVVFFPTGFNVAKLSKVVLSSTKTTGNEIVHHNETRIDKESFFGPIKI